MLLAGALAVQTGGDADAVPEAGQDVLEVLLHGFRTARQVDDERLAAQYTGGALSIPRGVMERLWYRMASAMPGALRSATA